MLTAKEIHGYCFYIKKTGLIFSAFMFHVIEEKYMSNIYSQMILVFF